jgi:hypothetical protein
VPTTIAEELATNPFMRVHEPAVAKAAVGGGCCIVLWLLGLLMLSEPGRCSTIVELYA